jgi:hypothetical protein
MKMKTFALMAFFGALMLAFSFLAACGDDDDDDSSSDDTEPTSCEDAMTFMFSPQDGCFTLTDADENAITPEELCTAAYEDVAGCYKACYDENDDCDSMGDCLTTNCGLNFG